MACDTKFLTCNSQIKYYADCIGQLCLVASNLLAWSKIWLLSPRHLSDLAALNIAVSENQGSQHANSCSLVLVGLDICSLQILSVSPLSYLSGMGGGGVILACPTQYFTDTPWSEGWVRKKDMQPDCMHWPASLLWECANKVFRWAIL
jgi:hypothetical protein